MTQPRQRIACFGGIYSNHLALKAAIDDVARRGVDAEHTIPTVGDQTEPGDIDVVSIQGVQGDRPQTTRPA